MSKSLYVIGNSTLINGQFSFTIFDTYYPDKQSALKRAKSEAEASLNNYQKDHPNYILDTVRNNDPDTDDHLEGYAVCDDHGGPVDIMMLQTVHEPIK